MHSTTKRAVGAALLAAALAGGLAACGDDDTPTGMHGTTMPMYRSTTPLPTNATAADVDAAFVRQMIPHHQMAVVMAKYAQQQAKHAEVKQLADDIIAAQTKEIAKLRAIAKAKGYDLGAASSMMSDDGRMMGLSAGSMGMGMRTRDLDGASGFDRAFLVMMIPHHEGAIAMAKAELARGSNPELKTMSKAIIAAQTKEIAEMRGWLKDWYGDDADQVTGTTGGRMMDADDMPMH